MNLAPIALFTYNRLSHTRSTVESLLANELASNTDIIIYSDGPKADSTSSVEEVRSYLKTIHGFKSIKIVESPINKGLAKSIIEGVTETLKTYPTIIVIEDDMVTSKFFLKYMNDALSKYQSEDKVVSIHGYNYPVEISGTDTFFLRGADCWGWATWRRGWEIFNPNGVELLNKIKVQKLEREFDFNNSFPYMKMLEGQIEGKNNSWAIRWYASAFLENKLTLYPSKSLVLNIGNDGSGTHCLADATMGAHVSNNPVFLADIKIEQNYSAKKMIENFFNHKKSFWRRIRARLKI